MKGLVQVAGIRDQGEADMLAACGVDTLGFPFRLAVHKEDLSEEAAARIIRGLKPPVEALLITYLSEAGAIAALCQTLGVSAVQLHGEIASAELSRLRSLWPGLKVLKSLIVRGEDIGGLEAQIEATAGLVDGYITDTFDPATGATGATGKTHDWRVSRHVVEISPRPVILAGGLNPDNVREAIEAVRPAGVDVHTGIEGADGRKDPELARRFVSEARAGFEKIASSSL